MCELKNSRVKLMQEKKNLAIWNIYFFKSTQTVPPLDTCIVSSDKFFLQNIPIYKPVKRMSVCLSDRLCDLTAWCTYEIYIPFDSP